MDSMHEALTRIEMEYREMPDLTLTFWQARRLWNLDEAVCEAALTRLVAEKFLWWTSEGRFIRRGMASILAAN